jgi:hypothetical protein
MVGASKWADREDHREVPPTACRCANQIIGGASFPRATSVRVISYVLSVGAAVEMRHVAREWIRH